MVQRSLKPFMVVTFCSALIILLFVYLIEPIIVYLHSDTSSKSPSFKTDGIHTNWQNMDPRCQQILLHDHVNEEDCLKPKIISDACNIMATVGGQNICDLNFSKTGISQLYNLKKRLNVDATSAINCTATRTIPSFKICIHQLEKDILISKSLVTQGLWEDVETILIQKSIKFFPEAIFIDMGANIGYFSLLARAMGLAVIAIEPNDQNFLLLEEGIARNNFSEGILLLKHAVSDRQTSVVMGKNVQNQGAIPIIKEGESDDLYLHTLTSITVNDLLNLMLTNEVIIKMDIEGYECKALKASDTFFKKAKVRYLFMEWFYMVIFRNDASAACPTGAILNTLEHMVNLGFSPYSTLNGEKLDIKNCWNWKPTDIFWAPRDSPPLF